MREDHNHHDYVYKKITKIIISKLEKHDKCKSISKAFNKFIKAKCHDTYLLKKNLTTKEKYYRKLINCICDVLNNDQSIFSSDDSKKLSSFLIEVFDILK